jgi:hypothetical protein
MTELSDANTKSVEPQPAQRKEYLLKNPIIQQGDEVPAGKKASLTDGQAERLKTAGVI